MFTLVPISYALVRIEREDIFLSLSDRDYPFSYGTQIHCTLSPSVIRFCFASFSSPLRGRFDERFWVVFRYSAYPFTLMTLTNGDGCNLPLVFLVALGTAPPSSNTLPILLVYRRSDSRMGALCSFLSWFVSYLFAIGLDFARWAMG